MPFSKNMNNLPENGKLIVVEGRHRGAVVELSDQKAIRVGNGVENDVVLYSGQSSHWSIVLRVDKQCIGLDVFEGEIDVDDVLVGSGTHVEIDSEKRVQINSLVFVIEAPVSELGNESAAPEHETLLTTPLSGLDSKSMSSNEQATSAEITDQIDDVRRGSKSRGTRRTLGNSLFSGFTEFCNSRLGLPLLCLSTGFIMLSLAPSMAYLNGENKNDVQSASLEQQLIAQGFRTLTYVPRSNGTPSTIVGAVESRSDKVRILNIVSRSHEETLVDLQINDELVDAIEDVYRVNGVSAQVVITGLGTATVKTRSNDDGLLAAVETQINEDIPGLTELTIENLPVEAIITKDEEQRPQPFDPDKRITLVVAGVNGYVMTADSSRYFVGSTLPSGYVVKSIENGSVEILKDGETLTLQF